MFIFSFGKAENLHKTSVQLMWLDQFEFAGFYVAKEKGFYKEFGLDVQIKKYNSTLNIADEVLENRADFGTDSSALIIEKSNGKDIILLGSIFQSSPLVLLSLKNSNFNSLKDLKNKKLMITKDQQKFAPLLSMLTSEGLSLSDLQLLEHSFDVNDLINKNTDLMLAYTTNEPDLLRSKGFESKMFHPKDYGFDFYENIIFTSHEFALKNPDVVKNFYDATIKGWEYSFNNIEEISKLIFEKYNPQNKSIENIIFEANEMKKLAYDKNGKIGTITEEKINLIINTYKLMGLMKNPINADDIIYTKHHENILYLENHEKEYLKNKKIITMCIDPDWLPFEKIDNGKYIGISAEYIKIIEEKIKTPIKLITTKNWSETLEFAEKRVCDMIPLIMETPKRKDYLDFTKPYINLNLVLVGNITSPFFDNINQVQNEKIGISKDYAHAELLRIKYPNIKFVDVINAKDGLKKIENEEIFGFIGTLSTLGYNIQKEYVGQLKIIGKLDESINLSIGTRNDEKILNTILNKAILNIDEKTKNDISNRWISVNYSKEINYTYLNKILISILVVIIILVLVYRQYLLKKMNKNLNEKIKIEIDKNEEKNRILIQQSRMASMGEMLENIAHQWRQPLSTISTAASGIQIKKELGILEDEEFQDSINHIKHATKYLSNTIDDFRNFFSKEKTSSIIHIRSTINKALDLMGSTFARNSVVIIRNIQNIKFSSYENELIQVLMNILVNAKDVLENQKYEKLLIIKVEQKDENIIITIKDNAGGIENNIIDKVFEPYFTTKHKYQGTGIGLYMSKLLVEKHLDGEITVANKKFTFNNKHYKGAMFRITLPLI
uniref:ABC transporter substrate-binding protein n=3 Tax=Aliarcobacter sp. TaxID=2321116 RepID=UPI0040485BEA